MISRLGKRLYIAELPKILRNERSNISKNGQRGILYKLGIKRQKKLQELGRKPNIKADKMVYKLYDLTPEEIEIVEKSLI
jgi:hypothetical protein